MHPILFVIIWVLADKKMKWSQTVKNVTFKLNKEVMKKENILRKIRKVVVASLPIKNIDEIELIKD